MHRLNILKLDAYEGCLGRRYSKSSILSDFSTGHLLDGRNKAPSRMLLGSALFDDEGKALHAVPTLQWL